MNTTTIKVTQSILTPFSKICLITWSACTILLAQSEFIPISGVLPPTVKNQGKPYLVTDSLKVPEGGFTIIEKGTVFLFKNFTGISVSGAIRVEGLSDEPVVFTSENDSLYNPSSTLEPAAFDWDGIVIGPGEAENVFEHCQISYSLFGIDCARNTISFKACTFIENGNADLSVAGVKQNVTSPYTSRFEPETTAALDVTKTEETPNIPATEEYGPTPSKKSKADQKPVSLVHEPLPKKKGKHIGLRILSLAAVGAGGALGARETRLYIDNKKKFEELNSASDENLMNHTSEEWNTQKDLVNQHLIYMVSFYGIALLGATVFTITFAF